MSQTLGEPLSAPRHQRGGAGLHRNTGAALSGPAQPAAGPTEVAAAAAGTGSALGSLGRPVLRRTRRALTLLVNLATVVGMVAFLLLAVGPRTGQYRTITMLSGSMAPRYPPGAVLVITPRPLAMLAPGEVVTFHAPTAPGEMVTHRVVSVDRSTGQPVLVTKGDANPVADAWRVTMTGTTFWQTRAVVPYLGTVIRFLRTPLLQLVLTRGLPALLLVSLLTVLWRPRRRPR